MICHILFIFKFWSFILITAQVHSAIVINLFAQLVEPEKWLKFLVELVLFLCSNYSFGQSTLSPAWNLWSFWNIKLNMVEYFISHLYF